MVSRTTNRGLAFEPAGRVTCLSLPVGTVWRARTGGGYGAKKIPEGWLLGREEIVLPVLIRPGEAEVEGPLYRMDKCYSG